MSTNHDKQTDKAIAEFEAIQVKHQFRKAIERLSAHFAELEQDEDGLNSARALIERIHLIAGNRRHKHLAVNLDRRGQQS